MVAWEIYHDQEKILKHFLVIDFANYVSAKLNFLLVVLRAFESLEIGIEFIEPNLLRIGCLFRHLLKDRVLKDVPVLLTINTFIKSSEHAKNNVLALNDLLVSIHPLKGLYLEHR